jgi:hypothetical protein
MRSHTCAVPSEVYCRTFAVAAEGCVQLRSARRQLRLFESLSRVTLGMSCSLHNPAAHMRRNKKTEDLGDVQ